jgi:hypothetical protein
MDIYCRYSVDDKFEVVHSSSAESGNLGTTSTVKSAPNSLRHSPLSRGFYHHLPPITTPPNFTNPVTKAHPSREGLMGENEHREVATSPKRARNEAENPAGLLLSILASPMVWRSYKLGAKTDGLPDQVNAPLATLQWLDV